MKGFERFQQAMIKAAQQHMEPMLEEHKDALEETVRNELFELDGPRQIDRTVDPREQYFWKIFRGYLEISKSLDTLADIAFYIGRFPFQRTRITRERYLQFHVGAYFSEIYILRERLTRYIKLIERQYRKDPRLQNVQKLCNALTDAIKQTLDGPIDVRRRHVHESHFSDDSIDRLSTIALLSQGFNDELSNLMCGYYRTEHRRVKKIWVDHAKTSNKAIHNLMDVLFDSIFPIVFDEETSTLRYPKGVRT